MRRERTLHVNRVVVIAAAAAIAIVVYLGVREFVQAQHSKHAAFVMREVLLWVNADSVGSGPPFPADITDTATGECRFSWRFKLAIEKLPSTAQPNLDESWSSPTNQRLSGLGVPYFSSALDGPPRLWAIVNNATSKFNSGQPNRGTAALLIETATGRGSWMECSDLDVGVLEKSPLLSMDAIVGTPANGLGFHVCFADGAVYLLKGGIPCGVFKDVCRGGQRSRDEMLRGYIRYKVP